MMNVLVMRGFLMAVLLRQLLADERGATAVEYSLIAVAIAAAATAAIVLVGGKVKGLFASVDIPDSGGTP
jgi:Flp pilus assembly pilin Flp